MATRACWHFPGDGQESQKITVTHWICPETTRGYWQVLGNDQMLLVTLCPETSSDSVEMSEATGDYLEMTRNHNPS